MLTAEEVRILIQQRTETKNIDFKEAMQWATGSDENKLSLIKDILAMANTRDGGKIIIGVRDRTFEIVGVSPEQAVSFDQTQINTVLHNFSEPRHACQVSRVDLENKTLIVLDVPEYRTDIVICKRDGNSSTGSRSQILRAGAIYIRTDRASSEEVPTSQDMRELLGRAIQRKGDELLNSIRALLVGAAPKVDFSERYAEEFVATAQFFDQSLGSHLQGLGYWEVLAYPNDYFKNRVPDFAAIDSRVRESEVNIRGWNFPHTDQNAANFGRGRQSVTLWDHFIEGYRAYASELFSWRRAFWEDIVRPTRAQHIDGPVLSFIGAIYSVSEFFAFFERYYSSLSPEEDLHYRISLHGVRGRRLFSDHWYSHLSGNYSAVDDPIIAEGRVTVAQLRASYKELAVSALLRIFQLFNWNSVNTEIITNWQNKFFNRDFS